MKKRISIITLLMIFILSSSAFAMGERKDEIPNKQVKIQDVEYYKGTIVSIKDFGNTDLQSTHSETKLVKVKISTGKFKGKTVDSILTVFKETAKASDYSEGDRVILFKDKNKDDSMFIIMDHYRMTWVYYLAIFFVVILFLVGGKSGFKSMITLIISIIMIISMLPLISRGYKPITITLIASVINAVLSILVIAGFTKKSLASILATITGLAISFVLAMIIGDKTYITGLSNDSSTMLLFLENPISPKEIVFASIILGSLGAVMDVTVSIASAIEEIHKANTSVKVFELYKSGMNVGRDIMGTMSNTLILAYFSSFLPVAILVYLNNSNMPYFYNMDMFVTEMVRILAGTIGLILVIPFTCIISSLIYKQRKKNS